MMNELRASKQPSKQEMERAFFARDASYDGVFYVGVRTTRIYCVPSCAAASMLSNCFRNSSVMRL